MRNGPPEDANPEATQERLRRELNEEIGWAGPVVLDAELMAHFDDNHSGGSLTRGCDDFCGKGMAEVDTA